MEINNNVILVEKKPKFFSIKKKVKQKIVKKDEIFKVKRYSKIIIHFDSEDDEYIE